MMNDFKIDWIINLNSNLLSFDNFAILLLFGNAASSQGFTFQSSKSRELFFFHCSRHHSQDLTFFQDFFKLCKMSSLRLAAVSILRFNARRNLTLSAVAMQQKVAADPIQQLFAEKVREYANKKKASGGKLVSFNARHPCRRLNLCRFFLYSLDTKVLF